MAGIKGIFGITDHRQRTIRIISAVVILLSSCTILFTATCRYFVRGPEDTVNSLFRSLNKGDASGVLECLDPQTQQAANMLLGLAGELTGTSLDADTLSSFVSFLDLGDGDHFKVNSITIQYLPEKDGENIFGSRKLTESDAEAHITYSVGDRVEQGVVVLHKYQDGWKIEGDK